MPLKGIAMSEKQYCPRSLENGGGPNSPFKPPFNGEMIWKEQDKTCSYCGSLNPDYLMQRLEAGDVEITPTDKSYKIYVKNNGGDPLMQHFRECPQVSDCTGPHDCTHWVTREASSEKFYFQHLNPEQRVRFIELYNDKKLHLGYPGHFYVVPFFCKVG